MFEDSEQKAILKLIDSLIKADGRISIKEVDFLEEMMTVLSFKSKNLSSIAEFSYENSIETIKAMEPNKKKLILKNLTAITEADNYTNPEEIKILEEIKKLIL